jgi:hypothetical protein
MGEPRRVENVGRALILERCGQLRGLLWERSIVNTRKAAWTKTTLRLPDLDHAKVAVLTGLRSPESQRTYEHAIDEFIAWYCSEPRLSFNKDRRHSVQNSS